MTNKKTDRLNIQDFLFSVRLLSLFFAAIAFLQFAYWQVDAGAEFASYVWYVPLAAIAIAAAIYLCLFNLRRATKRQQRWGKALECGLMLGVFFFAIAVTGLWESQYKILFLFLIISYTFESGMRVGLGLAAFCSLAVLAIDAVWAPTQGGVNLQMQNDLLLCGAFIVTAWALGFYSQIRQEYIASLEKQVRVDGLTGLLNHRSFYDAVQAGFERAVREDQPLSLIFADVDYFKTHNDCHGHQAGDAALVAMAGLFTQLLGDGKQIFRYGGEEFSLILP
ncbi:GGDEF domain-containing protein, partial [Clostridium sp. ATCC 29733]